MHAHARNSAPAEERPHIQPSAKGPDGVPSRHDTPAAVPAEGGRDAKGRFTKGNKGGPGNPFARQVAGLRRALLDVVTEEDMEAIARELLRQAREGDLAAIKLLLSYTVGRPAEVVDPDQLDLQEWEQYKQGAQAGPELVGMLHAMPVGLACHVQRAARPGVAELYRNGLLDGLQGAEQQDGEVEQEQDEATVPDRSVEEATGPAFPARPDLGLPQGLTEAEWLASLGLNAPVGSEGGGVPSANGDAGAGRGARNDKSGACGGGNRKRGRQPSANGGDGRGARGRRQHTAPTGSAPCRAAGGGGAAEAEQRETP